MVASFLLDLFALPHCELVKNVGGMLVRKKEEKSDDMVGFKVVSKTKNRGKATRNLPPCAECI